MAVQVWIGEKPENPNERRAIVALANGLERLDGLYLILANFNVGGRTIDLVIIKQDAIFIIELKHCDGKIFGGVNGHWYIESPDGSRKRLNPGRKNPYNQVVSYYYSFINFLNEHRADFLSAHKADSMNFRACKRVIVIVPTLEPGSEVELDWKVEIKGFDELPTFLVTERSADIELTDEEMLKIPGILRCTRWKEINDLLQGVLPNWNSIPETTPPAPTLPPAVFVEPLPPVAPRVSPLRRVGSALRASSPWLMLGTSLLAVVLLVILLVRSPRVEGFSFIDQPLLPPQSPITTTSSAAGGMLGGGMASNNGCVWSGFQSVGKRWDASSQRWISVGVDGVIAGMEPEVVVTLEQVVYCQNQITLTWSVRNNSDVPATLPLRSDNIIIRDPFGNEYTIADNKSQPAELRVEPASIGHGQAIVLRGVSQNAPSLLVRLKEQPFGEASWLVSLDGN